MFSEQFDSFCNPLLNQTFDPSQALFLFSDIFSEVSHHAYILNFARRSDLWKPWSEVQRHHKVRCVFFDCLLHFEYVHVWYFLSKLDKFQCGLGHL